MNRWFVVALLCLSGFAFFHFRKVESETAFAENAEASRKVLLLAGFESNNIVSYDIETNVARDVIIFTELMSPRGIGQSSSGDLYVATRQGNKNVIRIGLPDARLEISDFTEPIGRYGPAQSYVDDGDQIYVAGDTTHEVRVYLPDGTLGRSYQGKSIGGNVCGFAVSGQELFTTHLFRGAVGKHTLGVDLPPMRFQMDPEVMKNAYGVLMDADGKLLVGGSRGNGQVLELDAGTGEVLGVFVDLEEHGLGGVNSMAHFKERGSYFVATASGLIELDDTGRFVGRHDIDFIGNVAAICIARDPQAVDRMALMVSAGGMDFR